MDEVTKLSDEGKIDAALDIVFRRLDDMFYAGQMKEVADILDIVDSTKLQSAVTVGFLTFTLTASKIHPETLQPARARLADRFRASHEDLLGKKRMNFILKGLI